MISLSRVVRQAVVASKLLGDRLAQWRHAGGIGVGREAVIQRLLGGVDDVLRRRDVRLSAPEGDDVIATLRELEQLEERTPSRAWNVTTSLGQPGANTRSLLVHRRHFEATSSSRDNRQLSTATLLTPRNSVKAAAAVLALRRRAPRDQGVAASRRPSSWRASAPPSRVVRFIPE